MLSDEWLSRYGLLENFNASVTRTRTRTGTGTGTWTTGVTAIALCTSCSRAKKHCLEDDPKHTTLILQHFTDLKDIIFTTDEIRGDLLLPPYGTTPAAVIANKI